MKVQWQVNLRVLTEFFHTLDETTQLADIGLVEFCAARPN
jgi:hypothetical protein